MTLVIELLTEQTAALSAKAEAQGVSPAEYVRQILEQDLAKEKAPGAPPSRSHSAVRDNLNCAQEIPPEELHPAARIILAAMKNVPPAEHATMPRDGASQHDHYIYGLPKGEE